MAELTFKSAGVSTREIDLSGPTAVKPQGVPAGIIGTAQKGPAFVPITVATWKDFVAEFGGTDGKKFGPLAMHEWMKNARSGCFVRVLGAGDGTKRDGTSGRVTNAGFVVGAQLPQNTDDPTGGLLDINPFASDNAGAQVSGRTYFLGGLYREDYDSAGEAAAASTVTFGALSAADFEDSKYGEGIRFADSTGDEHVTIWFHEGASDTVDADGETIPEDSRNIAVSVGLRHSLDLTVATVADMDNRVLQLTDVEGQTVTLEFNDGAGSVIGDLPIGGLAYQLNIAGLTEETAADAILAFINDSDVNIEADAKSAPTVFTVRLDSFGDSADEPDGGTLTAAVPNITLSTVSGDFAGGVVKTGAEIAQSAVDRAAAVGGLAADLVLSVSGNDLVVTQGTVGTDGNDVADPDPGSSVVTTDWVHDIATITAPADPTTLSGETLGVCDLGTDQAGTLGQRDVSFEFIDDRTPVQGADPVQIGVAASAPNVTELSIDNPAGEWHAGDQVTIVELAADGTSDVTRTFTITFADAGLGDPSMTTTGGHPDIIVGMQQADYVAAAAIGAAQVLWEAIEDVIDTWVGWPGDLEIGDVVLVGDTITITQDKEVARSATVSSTIALAEGNVEIKESADATVTETDAGHTAMTDEELAGHIEDALAGLNAVVSRETTVVTVEQRIAGPHDLVALNLDHDADPATDDVANDSAGLVAEDVTAGAGDFGAAGGLPTNLAASVFSGGGDPVESGPTHSLLADAGIDTTSASKPLIRAVIMTPQGVVATLESVDADSLGGAAGDGSTLKDVNDGVTPEGGSVLGSVTITGTQERITVMLNGHTGTPEFPATLRCSLDPQAPDYFMNVLNHDAACMEKAGHYVYAHYNVYQAQAAIDGTGHDGTGDSDLASGPSTLSAAFLIAGANTAHADDDGASADSAPTLPNYEDFQERFQTAKSPWVVSQVYGAKVKNLFRIHALDDGVAGSGRFKISIANVMMDSQGRHGQFDIFVRAINDDDIAPVVYEKFVGVDLNPSSERYLSRVIGDQYMYYDFDKRPGSQKLVVDGIHPARSKFIRVEMAPEVDAGSVPVDALPMGYRGYHHLNTGAAEAGAAGLRFINDQLDHVDSLGGDGLGAMTDEASVIHPAIEPPVPMRSTIAVGVNPKKRAQPQLYWGTNFQVSDDISEPNKNTKFNDSILSYCKYFPTFNLSGQPLMSVGNNPGVEDQADGTLILDSDRFNNNFFSLERIQIVTKSPSVVSLKNPNVSGVLNQKEWAVAEYRRDGALNSGITTSDGTLVSGDPLIDTRFVDPQTDLIDPSTRRFMKFSFFLQGGFDGTSIFNQEKQFLTNRAAVWEMDDTDQGGVEGSTIASFRKAVDVMAERADVDIKLLTVPGMREEAVTDYAIDAVEERFDAMYIMDVEEKAVNNDLMIDYSTQKPSVNLTVENLVGRNLDSSFAAAYFPDVVITDPALGTNVQCPPSVAVLGAFSLNDSIAHPWFAPAGFSRGALKSVVETQVKLSRRNLDTLYESDINPLAAFPHTPGVVVWGQKTLQQAQSALDRVNVRRLLIEIRREVRRVGNGLLFEPNREETLGRFSAAVNPILQRIQQQQGLDKFKVVIDTTTTTQADIENNTVRGKIFLQPTRTVEFISLDFVVTNAGMEV